MKKKLAIILTAALALSTFSFASAEHIDALCRDDELSIAGFSTQDLYNNHVTSDDLNDAVCTVINEWATWCQPCIAELPHFQELHEYYSSTPDADIQIFGSVYVAANCTPASARALLESEGITYPNLVEDEILEGVFRSLNSGAPTTIIVDRNGIVRDYITRSFASLEELRSFVETWYEILLAEEGSVGIMGDVDGNGVVAMADAVLALRMAMGLIESDNVAFGDINGSGSIDVSDSVAILRMAMGL